MVCVCVFGGGLILAGKIRTHAIPLVWLECMVSVQCLLSTHTASTPHHTIPCHTTSWLPPHLIPAYTAPVCGGTVTVVTLTYKLFQWCVPCGEFTVPAPLSQQTLPPLHPPPTHPTPPHTTHTPHHCVHSDADSGDAEMVDEEHIGVNAIMGSKKRKGAGGDDDAAAPAAAKEPKVCGGLCF